MSLSQRNRARLLVGALVLIAQAASAAAAAAGRQPQENDSPEGHGGGGDDFSQRLIIARHPGIAGLLLADTGNYAKLNQSSDRTDSLLADLLDRVGPDMRPMRGFRDFADITPELAARAWLLMHDHAQTVLADRMQFMRPLIRVILREANVSAKCSRAALNTIEAAKRLDSWAIQLLAAWGNFPPIGIYEGTFGDIGSYHGCLNVPANPIIGRAHYCTISYRPILAPSQSYELIVRREPAQLLALFDRHSLNKTQQQQQQHQNNQSFASDEKGNENENEVEDAFSELLRSAQYHHYVYYKLGTCFPIDCDPFDVQKLAKLVGHRAVLMSGPVKCHSKYEHDYEIATDNGTSSAPIMEISTRDLNRGLYIWKPHITGTQIISLIIVSVISLFIIIMTLIDLATNILPKKYALLVGELSSAAPGDFGANNSFAMPTAGDGNFIALHSTSKTSAPSLPEFDANNNNNNNNNSITNNDPPPTIDGGRPAKKVLSVGGYNLRAGEEFIRIEDGQKDDENEADATRRPLKSHQISNNGHCKAAYNNDDKKKNGSESSLFRSLVDDFSIYNNMRQYFHISESQTRNEIGCINGIRCITMSWIITNHTMQYNDWSAFARTREIETLLKSLFNQPLFNGSYLVDTFFLISGLLTSYSTFKRSSSCPAPPPNKGQAAAAAAATANNGTSTSTSARHLSLPVPHEDVTSKDGKQSQIPANRNGGGGGGGGIRLAKESANFSPLSYLVGRYLRLTPQIVFVSLLFILLPLMTKNGGPHWYTITGEYSENCAQNWWVNLLHIQAFYNPNEMCNFVSWWISVDMFYHLFALGVILLILNYGHRMAPISCAGLIVGHGVIQASRHYQLKLPPNLLSTIPQTGAMWSEMTLGFFWTPCAHALPYFLGFYLGHAMAREHSKLAQWFSPKRALAGWSMVVLALTIQSYSTYFWVTGDWRYTPLQSTVFHLISALIWSLCLVWIIVACQFKHGSFIDRFLSCKLFAILSKASYVVYLSHFLILFTFFGSQNLLLEPTRLTMLYIIVGNVCFAMLFGSILCFVYEMPWLKTQRRLMRHIR